MGKEVLGSVYEADLRPVLHSNLHGEASKNCDYLQKFTDELLCMISTEYSEIFQSQLSPFQTSYNICLR